MLTQIIDGNLSFRAACNLLGSTKEELEAWREKFIAFGVKGLRTTFLGEYRYLNNVQDQKGSQE